MIWPMLAMTVAAGIIVADCRPAYLLEVKDGDTVEALYQIGDDVWLRKSIRIKGIDTPEKGWRAKCEHERKKAEAAGGYARALLLPLVGLRDEPLARLCDISKDKYAGRRVATLEIKQGEHWISLGQSLISEGLAKPYHGGRKPSWCERDPVSHHGR